MVEKSIATTNTFLFHDWELQWSGNNPLVLQLDSSRSSWSRNTLSLLFFYKTFWKGVEFWLPCPDGLLIWTIVSWVEIDDLVII
jgi:hypothetical protein